jgi:protein-disulfide isomerase-like protein with CxxC motif
MSITVRMFTDPGCPWAYAANPALTTLQWRYGDALTWELVMIGLAEDPQLYVDRGYTPAMMAKGYAGFRRFGQPFSTTPKQRPTATSPMCRAVVAVRLDRPELEWQAFRELQFEQFTSGRLLDELPPIRDALSRVPGLDTDVIVARLEEQDVRAAYDADRARARRAAGSPTAAQGKTANTDGAERYTAPSLVFSAEGGELEAGGFQSIEAYDVCVANLAPGLPRRAPAADPLEVLRAFDFPLTTQEVAAAMTVGNDAVDRTAAELQLIEHAASGAVLRTPLGDDAVWSVSR